MSCIQQPSRCHWALLFDSRRTVARNLRAQWHATHVLLSLLIKTSRGGFMGYTGTHILMMFPRLSSIKHRSVPIKLLAFCMKYHYRLFCIFGITVVGPALSYRLARNSDFRNSDFFCLCSRLFPVEREGHTLQQVLSEHQISEGKVF